MPGVSEVQMLWPPMSFVPETKHSVTIVVPSAEQNSVACLESAKWHETRALTCFSSEYISCEACSVNAAKSDGKWHNALALFFLWIDASE